MALRDHFPIELTEFNGLWRRGAPEDTPKDHFTDCENVQAYGAKGVRSRDGLDIYEQTASPLGNILRIHNYLMQDQNTLLVLIEGGDIYHVINDITVLGPVLSIPAMEDFDVEAIAGRAYITPFKTYVADDGTNVEKGLENEFLYVYMGEGDAARKAGGNPPLLAHFAVSFTIANGGAGTTDAGFRLFAWLYETDTGFLTAPGPVGGFTGHTTVANQAFTAEAPVSPDAFVIARRLVATRMITNYAGNQTGYSFYTVPDGRIPNNADTDITVSTLFDADLLEEVTHLIDNFAEIPAGVCVTTYHSRLVLTTSYDDISLIRISAYGEPEAISQITGLLIAPLDGNAITNALEFRDVLYGFKRSRTMSWVDNDDEPTTWPLTIVDDGIGCPVHGIALVMDSGRSSIDIAIIATFQGVMLFNGRYLQPELTWKIEDYWYELDRNEFRKIQMVNNTTEGILYITLPNRKMLIADYNNGMDPKKIRWYPWRFDIQITTIAMTPQSELIIGSEGRLFE